MLISVYRLSAILRYAQCPCLHLTRVRVSGGHLCEAEALTEAAAETVALPSGKDGGREKTKIKISQDI